jgi:hypothetical protein
MSRLIIIAVLAAIAFTAPALAQQTVLEFLDIKLSQRADATHIQAELIARKPVVITFVRMRCEVFDVSNTSLGAFQRDYGSGDPRRNFLIVQNYYWRPQMQLRHIDNADHASCRFATRSDPLPKASVEDVDVEVMSTNSVQVTNRTPFTLSAKTLVCSGPDGAFGPASTYEMINEFGLGHPPGSTMTAVMRNSRWDVRTACRVTAVKVMEPPELR